MAILFAGTEPDAFHVTSAVEFIPNPAVVSDPDYSRGATCINQSNGVIGIVLDAGQDEVWIRFTYRQTGAGSGGNGSIVTVTDGSDNNLFVWRRDSSSSGSPYTLGHHTSATGRTMRPVGVPYPSSGIVYTVVLHFKLLGSNQALMELYEGGVLVDTVTVTTTWLGTKKIRKINFGSLSWSNNPLAQYTEVIVTDTESPLGWRLATLAPNGIGTTDQWAGSYVDVDEIGMPDDVDFISSDTADQVELFTMDNLSIPAQNMSVRGLVMSTRARVGTTGPQNIQPAVRSGGTTTFGSNISGLTGAFANKSYVMDNNPITASAWTIADVQNLELGYKSIT